MESPIATSYEIICEATRIELIKENLLFDAQPPMIIPYTLTDSTANTYSKATLMAVACKTTILPPISKVFPHGITALVIKANVLEMAGPHTNKKVSGVLGINSSLE